MAEAPHGNILARFLLKEHILKPYNEARNDEAIDDKKLRKILNNALKKIV